MSGDDTSADVAALRRQMEADRARDLERQRLLELVRAEQTRLATQTQQRIDMLMMKMQLEHERRERKAGEERMAMQRQLDKVAANARQKELVHQLMFRQERQERKASEERMQQQIRDLQRASSLPFQHPGVVPSIPSSSLDRLPLALPRPGAGADLAGSAESQALHAANAQHQLVLKQVAEKKAAVADMQRQLQADQERAERWRQEAAAKEATLARQKADMEHELQAQQEAFEAKARAQVGAEHKEGTHAYSQKGIQANKQATVQQQVEEQAPAAAVPGLAAPTPGATSSQSGETAPGVISRPARSSPSSRARLPEGMQQHFFICKCPLCPRQAAWALSSLALLHSP